MKQIPDKYIFHVLLCLAGVVCVAGLPIHLMDPDAALYASIARTMAETGNYSDLYLFGTDWLDKPHFPFWVTALSFRVFGISTVAYKLPAVLFMVLAALYTYRFAKSLYDVQTARVSVLVLLTAQHIVLSNSDVRAEPYLTGLVIAATYHFYRLRRAFSYKHLLLGSLLAACAMMTKGIFTMIPVAGAIAADILFKKEWKELLRWRWLAAIVLSLALTFPELISLYRQFDAHPEKMVFGRQGVSGIRFFFWDSQIGRFFNTGPIKGAGDPFFFIHTLLWAFLPWCLVLYYGLFRLVKENFGIKNPDEEPHTREFYNLGGAVLTVLVFSLSKFQLPHYTNIIFPFLAAFTARTILGIAVSGRGIRFYAVAQCFTIAVFVAAMVLLEYFFRPAHHPFWFWAAAALVVAAGIAFNRTSLPVWQKIFYQTCLASLLFNAYANRVFYPALLTYQAPSQAALYANRHFPGQAAVVFGDIRTHSFEFYLRQPVRWQFTVAGLRGANRGSDLLVYTAAGQLAQIRAAGIPYRVLQSFGQFHVTTLTPGFLNHRTRQQALETHVLVRIPKQARPQDFGK